MSTLERPFDATLMHQLVFKIVHGDVRYFIILFENKTNVFKFGLVAV